MNSWGGVGRPRSPPQSPRSWRRQVPNVQNKYRNGVGARPPRTSTPRSLGEIGVPNGFKSNITHCQVHSVQWFLHEYQPSGAGCTCSPSATPHHLQNPKWPPVGPKIRHGQSWIFDNERRPEGILRSEIVINQIITNYFQ